MPQKLVYLKGGRGAKLIITQGGKVYFSPSKHTLDKINSIKNQGKNVSSEERLKRYEEREEYYKKLYNSFEKLLVSIIESKTEVDEWS